MTLCIRGRSDCYIVSWFTLPHCNQPQDSSRLLPSRFWMLRLLVLAGRGCQCVFTSPRAPVICNSYRVQYQAELSKPAWNDSSGNGHGWACSDPEGPTCTLHGARGPGVGSPGDGRPQHSPAPWGSESRPGRPRGCGSTAGPCSSPSAPPRSSSTSFRRAASPRGRALRT